MSADLLFKGTQPASLNLIFGATESGGAEYIDATISADVGAIGVSCVLSAQYDNAVNRGVQTRTDMSWADAERMFNSVVVPATKPVNTSNVVIVASDAAHPVSPEQKLLWDYSKRTQANTNTAWDSTNQVPKTTAVNYLIPARKPRSVGLGYQDADNVAVSETETWIDLFRAKRPTVTAPWEEGKHHSKAFAHSFSVAARLFIKGTLPWDAAKKAPPGISPHVIDPGTPDPEKCYTPPIGNAVAILFSDATVGNGNLFFRCRRQTKPGETVVIPIRRIYVTTNSTSLVLADTGQPIPCKGLQLDIDADSWVWGWRADGVPANYLSSLKTTYGDLVELLASVNGTSFRVAVEHITRSRSFGKSALAISGRGRAAWLSAPYAPVANRSNASIMTAQQLMADALTENGVSIGWDIDWQITDWTVPSGVWNHTGTAMEACLAIAEAAGAYIQAHRTDQKLHVLPRFKEAPWNWNSLIPDFEVPEDVCTVESLEWVDLPDYNAVYVSGQTGGVLGHVVKTGSDGAKVAPMVTDPLLTAADAARQRGTSILSATGRQLKIGLSLPVLPETGIITPGKFMRYVESGTPRLGIVRGVSVASNLPKVRQTVQVESYEL